MADAEELAKEANLRGTLFRSNTIATKLLSVSAKAAASQYLVQVLSGVITSAIQSRQSYEVDDSRVTGAALATNQESLRDLCEQLFQAICSANINAPSELRDICRAVRSGTGKRHDDELASRMTGSFLFLRFLCPAIVMPVETGILPPNTTIPSETRRGLLLASKILQQLANGLSFGSKESYMCPFNPFILDHAKDLENYVMAMCAETGGEETPASSLYINPLPDITDLNKEPWQTLGDGVDDAILYGLGEEQFQTHAKKLQDALTELDDGCAEPLIATITFPGNSASIENCDFWAVSLLFGAASSSKADDLINALVVLFRHSRQIPALLKWVIERELSGDPVKCGKEGGTITTVSSSSSEHVLSLTPVVTEGIMWKTSHKVGQKPAKGMGKPRYFMLRANGLLCYWKGDQQTGEPSSQVDICECCVSENAPELGKLNGFELVDRTRCLRLFASSAPEKDRWVRGIIATRLEALKQRAAADALNTFKAPPRRSTKLANTLMEDEARRAAGGIDLDPELSPHEDDDPPPPPLPRRAAGSTRRPAAPNIPAPDAKICHGCKVPLLELDDIIVAMNHDWHVGHFCCDACGSALQSEFYVVNDKPYCASDHERLFVPKCAGCDHPLSGQVMSALGKQWHRGCFVCSTCGATLVEFVHADGKPYCSTGRCLSHSTKTFGVCTKCHREIVGEYLETMEQMWHKDCFSCEKCYRDLSDGHFFKFANKPHCMVCFNLATGNVCYSCQQVITEGKVVSSGNNKFHINCFKCNYPSCEMNLVNKEYFPLGSKFFCDVHGPIVARAMNTKNGLL